MLETKNKKKPPLQRKMFQKDSVSIFAWNDYFTDIISSTTAKKW